ncbi:MAG: hypothetical protein WBC44_04355 [Planctomycetaceae bacterium]
MSNDSAQTSIASEVATARPAVPIGAGYRFGLSFTAGLAAGALAFVALFAMARNGLEFRVPEEIAVIREKRQLSLEEAAMVVKAERKQAYQNTALTVAVFGAFVGGLLGMIAGVSRKSLFASSAGLFGGTVVGAGAGAVGGLVDLYALEWLWPMGFDHSYKAMVGHSAAFLIAGVGIGGAAGLAARQVPQTLGVVLAAALIAGLIYPGVAAALFPMLNTDAAIPEGALAQLLWLILPAGLMGLAMGRTRSPLLPATRTRRWRLRASV